jgi:hypothetical protein
MSIAAADTHESHLSIAVAQRRAIGILTIATGIASIILLAIHPGDGAKSFSDILRQESSNRLIDGIVHGGFIAVLGLQLVCYTVFSACLGYSRAATIAGLVFFAMGAMFLSASMVLDGFATPAVAARYLAAPAKIEFAKSLFVLIGTLIGVLMPVGLMFQSAAIAAWGWALAGSGLSPKIGYVAAAAGIVLLVALATSFGSSNSLVLMGAIVATAVWACVAGAVLVRRSD